jgi:hypothetical protein
MCAFPLGIWRVLLELGFYVSGQKVVDVQSYFPKDGFLLLFLVFGFVFNCFKEGE